MAIDEISSSTGALAPTLAPLLSADVSARAAMQRLSGLGFRHVQLSATHPGFRPRELDQSARRDLLATLRRAELTGAGLDCWIPAADFSHPAKMDRAVSALRAAIDLAADLGRIPISVTLPDEGSIVQNVVNHAQHQGVSVADYRVPAIENAESGIGIDPAAWLSQDRDPIAAVRDAGNRLVTARLCDLLRTGMRGPIGDAHDGRLDALAYKVELSVNGFHSPIVVDARQWADPWGGLQQSAGVWSNAC